MISLDLLSANMMNYLRLVLGMGKPKLDAMMHVTDTMPSTPEEKESIVRSVLILFQ